MKIEIDTQEIGVVSVITNEMTGHEALYVKDHLHQIYKTGMPLNDLWVVMNHQKVSTFYRGNHINLATLTTPSKFSTILHEGDVAWVDRVVLKSMGEI